ncbi:hypothetical protein PUR71_07365 [Streptomyces sp. SP17BM10]|uniref:hypothetical protein n=1 Tax=Streptomyces sp. SP17BM10 TaxID=3002530 RepID=UPI002E7735CB|nr:hypothetical protein [Streptomyces sp. SP17BM10]MEE1782738.1 hypothetical protein [Streptomyces sp. SP17BM10]
MALSEQTTASAWSGDWRRTGGSGAVCVADASVALQSPWSVAPSPVQPMGSFATGLVAYSAMIVASTAEPAVKVPPLNATGRVRSRCSSSPYLARVAAAVPVEKAQVWGPAWPHWSRKASRTRAVATSLPLRSRAPVVAAWSPRPVDQATGSGALSRTIARTRPGNRLA